MDGFETRALPTAELNDDLRAWRAATDLGFLQADAPDEAVEVWHRDLVADDETLVGVYPVPAPVGLPVGMPVATFATLTKTLNVGHGRLEPAHLIADVTVRATYRRRGLLRELMTRDLAEAALAGASIAALTASEATIYGRFGFGPATHSTAVEVDARRAALPSPERGRVEIVDAAASGAQLAESFARFHAATRGSIDRLAYFGNYLTGLWDYRAHAPSRATRVVVHRDDAGRPDGHAVFTMKEQTCEVRDLVAADPAVELALWHLLLSIDLVERVSWGRLSPASPLRWALADPRALSVTGHGDFIWLRILDVPKALAARGWDADGAVSFAVTDPLGHASGCWHVAASGGVLSVEPADHAALTIEARALASLYSGVADARVLAAAGLIEGSADEVARLARLFRVDVPPYCLTGF